MRVSLFSRLCEGRRISHLRLVIFGGLIGIALALSSGLSVGSPGPRGVSSASNEITEQTVHYPSGDSSIAAFMAKPKANGKYSSVIVVHDNSGLNDAVKDAVRTLAVAGFVAIAPDLLSRERATQSAAADATQLSPDQTVEDLKAAVSFLGKDQSVDSAKISSVGFGWGGWRTFKMAEEIPTLHRAVVYYGVTPRDEGLASIRTPILAHYAQYDFQVTGNSIWTKEKVGRNFTYYVYPDTSRGFFVGNGAQPKNAAKSNAESAKEAWSRTIDFLNR